jgi:hypothetical protein
MKIHIGKIIEKVRKGFEIANMDKFCKDKLNMTKQNYYRIIKEESINTDTLLKFCTALNHDFFQYYYEIEPLKSFSKKEIDKLKQENAEFRSSIERKEDLIKDFERKILILKEGNSELKQKHTIGKKK